MFKKVGWVSAVVITTLAVGGVATTAVLNADALQTYERDAPASLVASTLDIPAAGGGPVDAIGLKSYLDQAATDPRLGRLSGVVLGPAGEVIWEKDSRDVAKPASTTKILTAAAALLTLDPDNRLTTQVVRGAEPGTVVLKGSGDVMLNDAQLSDLARQIGSASHVVVDTSLWSSTTFHSGWDAADIDAGNIAPLEPAMLNGARLGGAHGDLPRSHTPAADVAAALAKKLGATSGLGTAPAGGEVVAEVLSDPLWQRLATMMEDSDNVLAEAIGREVALHRGTGNDVAAAVQATQDVLREAGFDLTGLELKDNSGLSEDNYNTPRLLADILHRASTDARLRPLLDALPIAGGTGTLQSRFSKQTGRGWVRAKTGTLTGVSALAGVVTATDGNTYTFALLSNDSDILAARAGLDELVSGLR